MKNKKIIEKLKFKIEVDGFEYAIEEYGGELAIKDELFSQFLQEYLNSKSKILNYLVVNE